MSNAITRADYEELQRIAGQFGREADATRTSIDRIKAAVDRLEAGDWVGKAATTFYGEMNGSVYPSLRRLMLALQAAQRTTREIASDVRMTEEEIAQVVKQDDQLSGGDNGGNAGGLPGGLPGGLLPPESLPGAQAPGGSPGGAPGGLSPGGPSPDGANNGTAPGMVLDANGRLQPARPPSEVFAPENINKLIGKDYQGAGSQQLQDAMNTLYANRDTPNSPEAQRALEQIAEARGLPLDKVKADYAKYQQLLSEQRASGEVVEGLNAKNASFMGEKGQLRYGDVVGQVYGIDPVFGSLLNPTGGLVGPGNNALNLGDTAVSYHGAVHDAGGYLYNVHKTGPGYNYLGVENRDPGNPLTGQQSGIEYWRKTVGDDPESKAAQVAVAVGVPGETAISAGSKAYDQLGQAGNNAWDNIREFDLGGLVRDGYRDLGGVKRTVSDGYDQVKIDIEQARRSAGSDIQEAYDTRGRSLQEGGWSLGKKLFDFFTN
jgi:WXG100 family type VII secretion target